MNLASLLKTFSTSSKCIFAKIEAFHSPPFSFDGTSSGVVREDLSDVCA